MNKYKLRRLIMKYAIQYSNIETTSIRKIEKHFSNDKNATSLEIINLYKKWNEIEDNQVELNEWIKEFPKFSKFINTPQESIYTKHKNMYRNMMIHLIEDRNISIRSLSIEVELSYSTLHRFIKGDNSKISLDKLDNITRILQVVL